MSLTLLAEAEALEQALGDPHDPRSASGFAQALVADESERFPQAGFDALLALDYLAGLVPRSAGGTLDEFAALLCKGRLVARRDLSVAIATGQCLLGALPVWLGGSAEQRARLSAMLRSGASGALALTEEDHGSDLAASEVQAVPGPDGYTLRGTKWCINNATRGHYLTVLARTAEAGGSRGFSLFLVDKLELSPAATAPVAKLRTHGIRGADISGITFLDAALPASALVGKEGHGLDLVFKTMQVSRTMCSAFSLGAADTALRLTTEFARSRVLYGDAAYALPTVRAGLREAFLALLTADVLAQVGARALSVLPEQMSVISAVVKVLVPALCNEAIEQAAVVLGARHFLREGRYGVFQKLRRDAAVVALFDGSSSVNRHILAGQLGRLCGARGEERSTRGHEQGERARLCARVFSTAPAFDWQALKATSRGADDLVGGLDDTLAQLRSAGVSEPVLTRALALLGARDAFDARVVATDSKDTPDKPHELARLAAGYVWLVAGASALHFLAALQDSSERVLFADALCSLILRRVLRELAPQEVSALDSDDASEAELDAALVTLCEQQRMLSVCALRLASAPGAAQP